jgi:glycosyltransferase involved in cell wall biosynthesis
MTKEIKKPRLLWVNRYCLFDRSSGASLSVIEMLKQLARRGYDVRILGALNFDSQNGRRQFEGRIKEFNKKQKYIHVSDSGLDHFLVNTKSHQARAMTLEELGLLYTSYEKILEEFKPDIAWLYGGKFFDRFVLEKAKQSGAITAFYLANGNYHGHQWYKDVDVIITDSQATVKLYKEKLGIDAVPVGKFIDKKNVIAERHERKNITFINPRVEKGAILVAQLALFLETRRPDIRFEVVESRGNWLDILQATSRAIGEERTQLKNVVVTPTTNDMRAVYERARMVLAPSLWWESGGRVVVEALYNGIPTIITDHGGMSEMAGNSGIVLNLPQQFFESPYTKLFPEQAVKNVSELIEKCVDDDSFYFNLVDRALRMAGRNHDIEKNTDRLEHALNNPLKLR